MRNGHTPGLAATRRRRLAAISLVVAIGMLFTACGEDADTASPEKSSKTSSEKDRTTATSSTSVKPAPHYTVQQLAAKLGCTAKLQGKAKDFRQAGCKKDGVDFLFVDFDTTEGQKAWLEYAVTYGGVYLVGDRWAMSGKSEEYLESLSKTLGGTIQEKSSG